MIFVVTIDVNCVSKVYLPILNYCSISIAPENNRTVAFRGYTSGTVLENRYGYFLATANNCWGIL